MSLFSSSSKQTTTGTTSPTNPKPVTDSIIDFTKLIQSLGNRDPSQYVTGPSYLQNAAFSMGAGIANRYGVNAGGGGAPMRSGQPIGQPNGAGTLYGSAGIAQQPEYDYAGYVQNNPDIRQHYQSSIVNPKTQAQLTSVGADYDNDGRISEEEFGRYHYGAHGQGEGRAISQVGGASAGRPGSINGLVNVGGGAMMQGGDGQMMVEAGPNLAAPGYGYEAATMQGNPVSQYQDASAMTRNAGMAGPNLAQMAGLGPANTYGAATTQGVSIDPVTNARATQGYKFADPYMNQYTDSVVNTTLANFDEYAGRQRAAEAAQAAGNNAFGGSRFGVQRAITEEQIARERASQEAGLRFSAQDKAFGFGMQDASQANQVAVANAAAANQRAQAQAALDMQRELANMASLNEAGQFNAGSQNQFDLTRFGAANDMSRFNAGQGDTALARQLAAGGQLGALAGDMANNERADLAALAALGEQERGIAQQGATADLRLMELMAQLYGTMPYQLFQGQNSTGTQTGKSTPSALDSANSLLDFGSKVAGIFG